MKVARLLPSGWLLDRSGNGSARWMTVAPLRVQNPAYSPPSFFYSLKWFIILKMEPDNTALLRMFDYIVALLYGTVAAVFAGFTVPDGWPMIPAMLLGMILGMAIVFPMLLLFSTMFGGLQLVMLGMITGMTIGMGAGMADGKTLSSLAVYGAL